MESGLQLTPTEQIAFQHNIPVAKVNEMVVNINRAAEDAIFQQVSPEEWKELSGEDKALICGEVIAALLDPKKIIGVANGNRLL